MSAFAQKRKPRGATRFPDLFGAARIAEVHHSHLYRVLVGERPATARLVQALRAAQHPLAIPAARQLRKSRPA